MARRVPALILLGLALIVCVALAASESLTNRTGRTATALTITFSEQVRITSYDETVFPTKEPSSRSDTFRFSGGQLEKGARFSVAWTPSTAEITSTEWETMGAASSGSSVSNAPLTYEQIMAQIAHDPGPEEPLYVPAEGEQIWLTDLAGHADIYDNDSIKISYAPGFDKSQITRIDVYRNGVKMRFVPAVFDVLTNDQMKTFDGNPAENTPKSSHTDHAIMGYSYSFRFYKATGTTASAALVATVKSPVSAVGKTFIATQAPAYNLYRYDDAIVLAAFQQWKREGYAGIQFDVGFFMDSMTGTTLFPQYEYDTSVLPFWARTPTMDEVRRWLRLCREANLEAEVRISLGMTDQAAAQGGWRGGISPRSWDKWFENFTTICVEIARLAEAEVCAVFTPLVELNSCMRQTENVKRLLDAVSAVFSGRMCVTWSTSTDIPLAGTQAEWDEYWRSEGGQFWDWVGPRGPVEVGIEWWGRPDQNLETQRDQRLSVLLPNFTNLNARLVDYFHSTYPQCPVRLCEIGALNADGAALPGVTVSAVPSGLTLDYQEYSDCWAAFLMGAAELGTEVVCWSRHVYSEPSWLSPGSYFLDWTPALSIIDAFLVQP